MRYPKVALSARQNPAAPAGALLPTAGAAGYPAPALVPIEPERQARGTASA